YGLWQTGRQLPFACWTADTPQRGHPHVGTQASFGSLLPADLNVCCLRSLLPLRHLEPDLRPLVQRLEPAASDGRGVHEQIFAALIGRDEAVALVVAEPLDGSGCHQPTPPFTAHERVGKESSTTDPRSLLPAGRRSSLAAGRGQGDASFCQTV